MMYNIVEPRLFLFSLLCLLCLMIMLPVAMFIPSRFARPWI